VQVAVPFDNPFLVQVQEEGDHRVYGRIQRFGVPVVYWLELAGLDEVRFHESQLSVWASKVLILVLSASSKAEFFA
jgi:pyruvate formate-lyase activating enzyme-like uncharacterized protein